MTTTSSSVSRWLLAARPRTLPATVSPVVLGYGLAVSLSPAPVSPWLALVALASALCIQVSTNLVNDAVDFRKGADTEDRLGPQRVTQSGLISARSVMVAACVGFAVAALLGIPLIFAGGVPILVIGVLSIAAGFAYTAGPFPLAYLGLGEVFSVLFFGVAAEKGMAYVLTGGALWPWADLAALQVGLHTAALLAVNNCRDLEGDRKVGKLTLAARWGGRFARIEIAVLVIVPYALGGFWLLARRPWAAALPLLTAPLAIWLVRGVWREPPSRRFNLFLARTGQLQLLCSVLATVGLMLR